MVLVRFCPTCGDEFRLDVEVCSDCGTALLVQEEGQGERAPTDPGNPDEWRVALDDAPVSTLVQAGGFGGLDELEPALAAFGERKLPSRILVQNGRYLILVRPVDLQVARDLILSDHAPHDGPGDGAFDPGAGTYSRCPACETELHGAPPECPECGLELGGASGPITTPEAE